MTILELSRSWHPIASNDFETLRKNQEVVELSVRLSGPGPDFKVERAGIALRECGSRLEIIDRIAHVMIVDLVCGNMTCTKVNESENMTCGAVTKRKREREN